jgi:hypothetical protein
MWFNCDTDEDTIINIKLPSNNNIIINHCQGIITVKFFTVFRNS